MTNTIYSTIEIKDYRLGELEGSYSLFYRRRNYGSERRRLFASRQEEKSGLGAPRDLAASQGVVTFESIWSHS